SESAFSRGLVILLSPRLSWTNAPQPHALRRDPNPRHPPSQSANVSPRTRSAMHDKIPANGLSVSAPARLHLGFVDLNGSLGRRYGSLGLAAEAPETEIRLSRADTTSAHGPEQERVVAVLERCREALGLA